MSDLISRQAAIDLCKAVQKTLLGTYYDPDSAEYISECISGLEKLPSAQPERKKGKWIESDITNEKYICSICGGECWYYDTQRDVAKSSYCPNCGADMRGENANRD